MCLGGGGKHEQVSRGETYGDAAKCGQISHFSSDVGRMTGRRDQPRS